MRTAATSAIAVGALAAVSMTPAAEIASAARAPLRMVGRPVVVYKVEHDEDGTPVKVVSHQFELNRRIRSRWWVTINGTWAAFPNRASSGTCYGGEWRVDRDSDPRLWRSIVPGGLATLTVTGSEPRRFARQRVRVRRVATRRQVMDASMTACRGTEFPRAW